MKVLEIKILLGIMLILNVMMACVEKVAVQEAGISRSLAYERKEAISDVEYDLRFQIPSSKDSLISGKMIVSFNLAEDMDVVLDYNVPDGYFKSASINGEPVPAIVENEHVIIPKKFINPGRIQLEMEFRAGDQSLNRNNDFLYTLFVPDRASTCFPVFDQPDIKALYKLTLNIPKNWVALFNGPQVSEYIDGERKTITFGSSGPIPSYLFAFTAGRFNIIESERDGRIMRMFHREDDKEKVARNKEIIFDLHQQSIRWLENYTGIDYPFEKFDFALIPAFQYGGMEHPGAIFYRDGSLFQEESATINQELGRASLIAHETAHMWFGNLVTMEWFNDVWMKEVFANFMAAKMVNPQYPEINHELRFLLSHYPSAFSIDRSEGRHSVRQELTNLKNAGTLYGAVIYQKAPIVMKQLEMLIGEDTMQESLAEYLTEFSYANATWDDLVQIIDKKTKFNISEWSSKWVYGAGLPEIDILRENGKVVFTHRDELWLDQKLEVSWNRSNSNTELIIGAERIELEDQYPGEQFLFNSNGSAYAYFPLDTELLDYLSDSLSYLENETLRGAMWLQLNENLVQGNIPAKPLFEMLVHHLAQEQNPLILNRMLSFAQTIYWRFFTAQDRQIFSDNWESFLLKQMQESKVDGAPMMFFRTFRSTITSKKSTDVLLEMHTGTLKVAGVSFGESDLISNALILNFHGYPESILDSVAVSISSQDRKEQLAFVRKAVSSNRVERGEFFDSLKDPAMREHEPWVLQGLDFIFHPLREDESLDKIYPALLLLEEIQITGDIFFPKRWVDVVLGGHQSTEAVEELNRFLADHPEISPNLLNKILQAADITKRAAFSKDKWKVDNL